MLVDLLLYNASQLVTCANPNGPKRGAAMNDVGIIANGALAISAGKIVAVGTTPDLLANYTATQTVDASGKIICPGFVDPHTHVVYAGDRVAEWEMKLNGVSYLEILAAGGGIVSTMHATRRASLDDLVAQASKRLAQMLRLGTTTAESKTGYGLDLENELKQLQAMEILARSQPIELVPTLLSAHATPPECSNRSDEYVQLVIEQIIPAAVAWKQNVDIFRHTPFFIDVFCEQKAFDVAQAQAVLAAGQKAGLGVKAHVDQFNELGGVAMALDLGAISVDHLDVTGSTAIQKLAASETIAVVIPTVPFQLGSSQFANARAMIDAGCALALTTDLNPGSAPCPSLPLAMAIACRYQKLMPAEALNASTINAAHAIGLGDRIGSLEVGKQADLLVVDAPDYRHLAYQFGGNLVEMVVKLGKIVKFTH